MSSVGKQKKRGVLLLLLIWRKSCLVKHAYLLFQQVAVIKQVLKSCLVKLICLIVLKWKAFSCPDQHNPPIKPAHSALAHRHSTQPPPPGQVITNKWTLYMAAIIDPETVDGLGGPLGWWRHTENLYKLVRACRPKFLL